jgi:hypothetical protein
MSIAALTHTTFSPLANIQNKVQTVRGEFQRMGSDLTTGDLTKAQTDFVALSESLAAGQQSSGLGAQAFSTLGQSLQSGNLTSAQQAFAKTWPGGFGPDALSNPLQPPHPIEVGSNPTTSSNTILNDLVQLGKSLQAGSLSAAQQAFTSLQQDWQQVGGTGSASSSSTATTTTAKVNVNV